MDKQREEFEAWHFSKYYAADSDKKFIYELHDSNTVYVSYEVQHSWEAWQQAQKVSAPDFDIMLLQRYVNSIRHFNNIGSNCDFIEYDLISIEDMIKAGEKK